MSEPTAQPQSRHRFAHPLLTRLSMRLYFASWTWQGRHITLRARRHTCARAQWFKLCNTTWSFNKLEQTKISNIYNYVSSHTCAIQTTCAFMNQHNAFLKLNAVSRLFARRIHSKSDWAQTTRIRKQRMYFTHLRFKHLVHSWIKTILSENSLVFEGYVAYTQNRFE
jgi:hypothetical protein